MSDSCSRCATSRRNSAACRQFRRVGDVRRGEILGLIGPNGAGKSTLFNAIAGVRKPTAGRILFEGRDITDLGAPQRCALGIARTFQVVKSFETMRVIENVMVGALFAHIDGARRAREGAGGSGFHRAARRAKTPWRAN